MGQRQRRHGARAAQLHSQPLRWSAPFGASDGACAPPLWLAVLIGVIAFALVGIFIVMLVGVIAGPRYVDGLALWGAQEARVIGAGLISDGQAMLQAEEEALIERIGSGQFATSILSGESQNALLSLGISDLAPMLLPELLADEPTQLAGSPSSDDATPPERYRCTSTDRVTCVALGETCDSFATCRGDPSYATCMPFARAASSVCNGIDCATFAAGDQEDCATLRELCSTRRACMLDIASCAPLADNVTALCRAIRV